MVILPRMKFLTERARNGSNNTKYLTSTLMISRSPVIFGWQRDRQDQDPFSRRPEKFNEGQQTALGK